MNTDTITSPARFTVGTTYNTGRGDYCWTFTVIARTAKFITIEDKYGDVVRYHSTYGMDWAVPDARGFVEPVQTLLAKPHRRRAMGDAGRTHVKRTFTWSTAADQFADLFASVVPAEVAA